MKKCFRSNNKRKIYKTPLKAFTIPDLLAGIAIGAIVTLLAFYSLQLITQQYRNYMKTAESALEYQRFSLLFGTDIDHSIYVKGDTSLIEFYFKNKSTISWYIRSEYLVRESNYVQLKSDTMFIKAKIKQILYVIPSEKIISEVEWDLFPFGDYSPSLYSKLYTAENLITLEDINKK